MNDCKYLEEDAYQELFAHTLRRKIEVIFLAVKAAYLLKMFSESAYFCNFSKGGNKSSGLVTVSVSL